MTSGGLDKVSLKRLVGASMAFSLVPGCSCRRGGRCSRRFLELVL
jgi:hypothetical protein